VAAPSSHEAAPSSHEAAPKQWQNLLLQQQWQNLLLPTWHNLVLQLLPKVCMLACQILYRCTASVDMSDVQHLSVYDNVML